MDQAKADRDSRDSRDGEDDREETRKRLDLSVAQVSGSAIAAVVAAKLASTLGVYGTILGAGVISVIATCGGSVFQHLFKRTGEQIRVVTVHGEPVKASRRSVRRAAPARTQVLPAIGEPAAPPYDEEFGVATTHGTRVRGWKRSAVAAALVFLVSMGGITAYELISDQDFSGTRGTTTFGSVVGRGAEGSPGTPSTDETPGAESGTQQQRKRNQDQGRDREQGGSGGPSPDTGQSTREPDPTPSDSAGGDPAPTPTPTPTPSTATPTPTPTGSPSDGAPARDIPPTPTPTAE